MDVRAVRLHGHWMSAYQCTTALGLVPLPFWMGSGWDVFFVWYNFCRVHQTIRMKPAMEADWTDRVWTVKELLST